MPYKSGIRPKGILSRSKEYLAWANLKQRCDNRNNESYPDYGGRGITYCAKWVSFDGFIEDMGLAPNPSNELDRRKVDENYSKENCRWVTRSVQQINKRPDQRNKTGIKNVSLNTYSQNWITQVQRNNRKICLYQGKDFFEACCIAKSFAAREGV